MRFPGIIPALTTPFGADGAVDHAALERNATALLDAGVHGFVATGTMGEAGSLSAQERRDVIATAVRAAAGRVPVIAGVSSGTPAQSIAYARDAAAAGAGGDHAPAAARLPRRRARDRSPSIARSPTASTSRSCSTTTPRPAAPTSPPR